MKLRFASDFRSIAGRSKYDYLAVSCSRRIRGVNFGPAEPGCVSVVQCGGGGVLAPTGYRNGRYIVICHDFADKYTDILAGAQGSITIGFHRDGSEYSDTYPLDDCDMHRLPSLGNGTVVVGGVGDVPEDVLGAYPECISFNPHVNGRLPWNTSRELLSFYYRCADVVIHAGDGNGSGYLGAMAAWHCSNAVFLNGARPPKVTKLEDFLRDLVRIAR